jgi:hypothetical protein
MREIELIWDGPFTFHDLLKNENNRKKYSCSGVYLWKEVSDGKTVIAYVGKASGSPDLYQRQFQHYVSQIGGHYVIPTAYRSKKEKDWSCDRNNPEVLDIIFDKEKFIEIVSDGFSYINHLEIFLAPVSSNLVNIVERNLLFDLKPIRTKWGTKTEPSERIKIEHKGNI